MVKICNECGTESPDYATLCVNCGKNNFSIIKNNQRNEITNNNQFLPSDIAQEQAYPEQTRKSDKTKIIALGIVIILVVALLATSIFIFFIDKSVTQEVNDFFKNAVKVDGGPKVNLQSLATGNFQSIPS